MSMKCGACDKFELFYDGAKNGYCLKQVSGEVYKGKVIESYVVMQATDTCNFEQEASGDSSHLIILGSGYNGMG